MNPYAKLPQPIYVSGPMTGYPDNNRLKFNLVAKYLRDEGCIVLNPAEIHGDENWSWSQWMREALKMLLLARSIVLLPGWRESQGAALEFEVAFALGLSIEYWPEKKMAGGTV
jgi:hypothetical protein